MTPKGRTMNCEWCDSPFGVERANGSVTCNQCRSGFEAPPRWIYRTFFIELAVIAAVVLLVWLFVPGWHW